MVAVFAIRIGFFGRGEAHFLSVLSLVPSVCVASHLVPGYR